MTNVDTDAADAETGRQKNRPDKTTTKGTTIKFSPKDKEVGQAAKHALHDMKSPVSWKAVAIALARGAEIATGTPRTPVRWPSQ
jgi:hypothetical protein